LVSSSDILAIPYGSPNILFKLEEIKRSGQLLCENIPLGLFRRKFAPAPFSLLSNLNAIFNYETNIGGAEPQRFAEETAQLSASASLWSSRLLQNVTFF
jgi:hypothetical protein